MSLIPLSEKGNLNQIKDPAVTADKKYPESLAMEPESSCMEILLGKNRTVEITKTIRIGSIFRLVDIICLAYLLTVIILIFLFQGNVADGWALILNHLLQASGIVLIVQLHKGFPKNRLFFTVRSLYPVAVFALAWNYLTDLVPMIYGNYWATDWVIDIDQQIFGVHPTVWIKSLYRPWLDELMNICYSGYYLFMPSITLWLFIKKRYQDLTYALSIAALAYLSNFIFYYLFPVLGPHMVPTLKELSNLHYTGYWICRVTRIIQSNGGIIGGACPSSHVTAAIIWSLLAIRILGKTGYVMLLMTVGIIFSTVYLGYHHAFDAILAIVWALISYQLGGKMLSFIPQNPIVSKRGS